jgi:hypothetical protein
MAKSNPSQQETALPSPHRFMLFTCQGINHNLRVCKVADLAGLDLDDRAIAMIIDWSINAARGDYLRIDEMRVLFCFNIGSSVQRMERVTYEYAITEEKEE